jgi:GR25 family glycosyltransferase involved in LPS biosynthesis
MKVLVISLKDATERRNHIQTHLSEKGIDFEWVDAISGSQITNNQTPYHPNVIATFLSHKGALEIAQENDEETLILEDDAFTYLDNPFSKISDIIETDKKWDVIFLGWKDLSNKRKDIDDKFFVTDNFILAHSYIVNKVGARRILTFLGGETNHIDKRYSEMIRRNLVRGIFSKEIIFHQSKFKTQIPKKVKKNNIYLYGKEIKL